MGIGERDLTGDLSGKCLNHTAPYIFEQQLCARFVNTLNIHALYRNFMANLFLSYMCK